MARENQGLQIALIVFVMLTIVLGGGTYYFYKTYDEANTHALASDADKRKKDQQITDLSNEIKALKTVINGNDTETASKITTDNFKEDMNKYAGSYPAEAQFYRPLLEKMQGTINDKNAALAATKLEAQRLADQIKVFEAAKQQQIDAFQKERDAKDQELTSERAKFNSESSRIHEDETKLQAEMATVRKDTSGKLADADKAAALVKSQNDKLKQAVDAQANQIGKMTATKIDVFNGTVGWVDQRLGKVWINVGRTDSLPRQISFSVYPANTTDLTAAGARKASIEVTQILGDHLAEARILDDTISNPIIPGDKIYTPLWAPGEKRHFALAGFMDPIGDGKSHLQVLLDFIKANDGVVDAYIDDKTNKAVGAVGVNTRYLVLGEAPDEKGVPAMHEAFTKISRDAEKFGVQKLQMAELLQRMGWKNQTPVVHYGPGANPKDFAPTAGEGGVKKSPGSVSELFKPRRPPSDRSPGTMSATPPAAQPSEAPSSAPSSPSPPTAYQRF